MQNVKVYFFFHPKVVCYKSLLVKKVVEIFNDTEWMCLFVCLSTCIFGQVMRSYDRRSELCEVTAGVTRLLDDGLLL